MEHSASTFRTQPQPQRPHPTAPFHPHGDTATYRDLLLFEERLKMNAEMLRKRRRRYIIFLYTFVIATIIMAHRLMLAPPQTYVSLRALQGLLAVLLITLILFFASGMYDEKIRYARSYLTYSNKALRPLNMHLNTRRPPLLQTILSYLPSIFSNHASPPILTGSVPPPAPLPTKRRVSTSGVMPSIPPSSNPRGELIFSSRVDRAFREGYERYRSAFERRREEKERKERVGWWRIALWKRRRTVDHFSVTGGEMGRVTPTPPSSRKGTPPIPVFASGSTGSESTRSGLGSGSVSGGSIPGGSIPDGAIPSGSIGGRGRTRTPSPNTAMRLEEKTQVGGRERAESYSFVWTAHGDKGPLKRAP